MNGEPLTGCRRSPRRRRFSVSDEPSWQELIHRHQAKEFVGRDQELAWFRGNLALPVTERRFIVNIHGDAGVGKSVCAFLSRRPSPRLLLAAFGRARRFTTELRTHRGGDQRLAAQLVEEISRGLRLLQDAAPGLPSAPEQPRSEPGHGPGTG
ncbi:hypothetical protein [Peterkaempfera sp. SMS 1(5)a]|uniref:hypothetical protein n=1 Tax=Peterkaempfera podocarpi TaxID=3232308 RepID=UPI0036729C9B